jgi:cellulose synthase operon protein C
MRTRGALALFLVCGLSTAAYADLATGRDRLVSGDYKKAVAELSAVTGKDRGTARILLARAQIATGEYAAAEATLTALVTTKDATGIEARLVLNELRIATGRIGDARKDLEALYKDKPDDRMVRTALADTRQAQGAVVDAKVLFDLTIRDFDSKKLDLDDPLALYQLAEAGKQTAQFELANDSYRAALKLLGAPPANLVAKIEPLKALSAQIGVDWADLFSRKYASELAEQTLEEVFKVNPNHPDAHAAMAGVITDTSYDLAAVRHHLDAALAVNPRNVRALRVRASIEIDRNEWDAARATLDKALAVNAQDVEALAMKATIAWLRDDLKLYEAEKAKAFAVNPAYAELYRIVSRSAVREHRYVEAIELEKQAIKLKPDFFEAMAGAGLGYLRLGMEKEGLEWLAKAYKGDGYNVRTVNTLDLFDNQIPKDYSFQSTKNFKIRYHNREKPALARYMEPTMERAFADMVKRYGFTPKTPVVLELYPDKQAYAVRTVGLPDVAALGVCFGQVITAMSPMTGDINWGMVMWHELGHVFAIQLSNSRVPRWFTEGLSEYETLMARPEWRRENDADLYGALANKTLPSIGDLNSEFMQPDASAVVVAYFLSAVTVEWLAQNYGFPKLVEALKLYGKGQETPEVLKAITGKTIAQLDVDFRKYLELRLAPYAGTFKLPTRGFDDITKLEVAADAAPRDAKARASVALGYYYGGDAEKAETQAVRALQLDPKNAMARYIVAEVAVHKNDMAKAKALFVGLMADGHDSYDLRARMAQIATEDGDMAEVEKQLCAAKKLDPERSYPYQALSQIYKKQGNQADYLRELEAYTFIEQMELAPLKDLVLEHAKAGTWAKVKTYGEMATYINPQDIEILQALGKAYVELKDGAKALYTFDSALVANPPSRRPALVHLGRARAFALLGKTRDAKAAIDQAMKTEPENAELLELKAKLK